MKASIEEINGKKCTVIHHCGIRIPLWKDFCDIQELHDGGAVAVTKALGAHYATILPPLPRNPKPEDAELLYRYMAEGLKPYMELVKLDLDEATDTWTRTEEITHCTDKQGNKIEVAIEE